tara:strand:- start:622 stop:1773 length:1152 start_codon:yes stop_codon:yes gene_type:complete
MTEIGQTEFITTSEGLSEIIDRCFENNTYALDTEFHREKSYYPKLALIQFNYGAGVALVDPTVCAVDPLEELFNSDCLAVMHACSQDLEVLKRYCNAPPKNIFDTQIAAGFLGMRTPSLSSLHERFLKMKLPKGERLTDWFSRPLSKRQLEYAIADVENLLKIHSLLSTELINRERMQWAKTEFDLVTARLYEAKDPSQAWLKIKETRHLGSRSRGVAQAIAEWREIEAQSKDIPARFIISDIAIVGIAQRMPKSVDELMAVRGVDRKHIADTHGAKLLDLVQRGQNIRISIPKETREKHLDPSLRPAATLISAWLAQFAKDSDLDPALLGTRSDIELLLKEDSESRLLNGWRSEYVGEPIQRLLEGKASLAFERGRLLLEDR